MPKLRFGPAGKPLNLKSDIVYAPRYLRSLGLSSMEYAAVRGVKIDEYRARMLGEEARRNGVVLSLHAPYAINLASKNEATVKASIERLKTAIEVSAIMEAYVVVFHPGWYGNASKRESLEMVVKNLEPVVEYAKSLSENLWLGVETTGRVSQIGDLDEVIEICSRLERVRPVIDFAHIYARSMGRFIVSKDDVLRVIDALEKSLGRESISPLHVHYSKIEYGRGGEIRHRTLNEDGYGPEFRYVCEALCEAGIDAIIISESPLLELDALKMKEICVNICGSKCISD
ncbi:Endonuclease IV [Ignisphaera aggregans DSM 17230]|uniref:Endonuclease IV n=1 Tax=Ignisphaera aggregans (strain DSM 17230 / JCM 13409 / AQ1.S1) TaxID=583356 RepID=E0STI1_IGNAA|nr:Endonuclease IV [Ignisphaera aggregans DSM 17230]